MGIQFFWVFDIAVAAILLALIFNGIRKGFVASIAGVVSLILAFSVTLPLSELISNAIYENLIKDAVTEEINNKISSVIDGTIISELKNVDMNKAKINGREFSPSNFQTDSSGKITSDMSNLDLTGTGIENVDLTIFGITDDTVNYSSVNLGSVVFTSNDIEAYGMEKLILVSFLSDNIINGTAFGSIAAAIEDMAKSIPVMLSDVSDSVTSGDKSVINDILLSIISTETNDFARAITDDMVKPFLLVPIRALIFTILFVIIIIALNIAAKLLQVINKIPVIGGINKALGALAGLGEALIVIFLVCIFIQVIVVLSENELIFLNTMTIDETFVFRKIYYFEFLDFLV